MLSGTALNEQSDDFACQNDSEMRFKIDAKTDMVKSSDLLLFTTLWNDFDLSKVIKNRRKIEQEKQLIICRHHIDFCMILELSLGPVLSTVGVMFTSKKTTSK
jgi:hypothetical protein